MSRFTLIGKCPDIPGPPNLAVDLGGPHCVRTEHMALAAKAVAARQDRERAALVRLA